MKARSLRSLSLRKTDFDAQQRGMKMVAKVVKTLRHLPAMRYDLKDCPFCGSSPEIQYWHGGGPEKRLISCAGTDCDVNPMVTGETEREAIARWERRA